jgi:hypothetical protein
MCTIFIFCYSIAMRNRLNNKLINYKTRLKTLGFNRIFYTIIAVLIILLVLCFGFHLKHINGYVFKVDNFGENDKQIICPRVKVDNKWYKFNGEFGEDKSRHKAFIKPVVVKNYDCKRIFEKDEKYVKVLVVRKVSHPSFFY